jgi:hypothetical protein
VLQSDKNVEMERVQNKEINHEEIVTQLRKFGSETVLVATVTIYCAINIVNGTSLRT